MSQPRIDRRTLLRTFVLGFGAVTVGRVVTACIESAAPLPPRVEPGTTDENDINSGPTDQDEHVPGRSDPVQVEPAIKLPQQAWEARVSQLESEQARQYGRGVFTRADPGVWKTKENSHEPRPKIVMEGDVKKVEVVVEHVMGQNKLDSGMPAPAAEAGMDADAKADADAGPPLPPPPEHYITTIYVRGMVDGRDTVLGLHEFTSTDAAPPTVRFPIPAGVTAVEANEWCTLHGLWKSTPLAI